MLLYNKERATRFGVLSKDASSEAQIRWFELPAMYAYHVANSWQEGSRLRIFLCVYDEGVRLDLAGASVLVSCDIQSSCASVHVYMVCMELGCDLWDHVQFDFEATVSETLASMSEITIDLDSGSCSLRKVAAEPHCEFPVVPDRLVGAPLTVPH